jgi:HEAT repeat protein
MMAWEVVAMSGVRVAWLPALALLLTGQAGAQAPADDPELRLALLVQTMKDEPNERDRASTAHELGALGPKARLALPALVRALKDRDWQVRCEAAVAVARVALPEKALPALRDTLKDDDWQVRRASARALGLLGSGAAPALAGALEDRHALVVAQAARALGRLGPEAAEAAPALVRAVERGRSPTLRRVAGEALGKVGPAGVGRLVWLLGHDDRAVRLAAAQALAVLRPTTGAAVLALWAAREDRDAQVRDVAFAATRRVERPDQALIDSLVRGLKDKSVAARLDAARALGLCRHGGIFVAAPLVDALTDPERAVRLEAERALRELDELSVRDVLNSLAGALTDPSPAVRVGAAQALGRIGPPARWTAANLYHAWRFDPDRGVREAARRAMHLVDPARARKVGLP